MPFESHAIVELMGHARIAGKVSEETIASLTMLRVEVPKTTKRDGYTKYYGPSAIYCITPTDESTAQAAAESFNIPPVNPFVVRMPENPLLAEKVVYDDDDDYPDGDDPMWEDDDPDDFDDEELPDDDAISDDLGAAADKAKATEESDQTPISDSIPPYVHVVGSADWLFEQEQKAVRLARTLLDSDFVIFDTETTGFGSDDEIIQIGIIDHKGNVLLDTYIKPTKTIPNTDYHHISTAMVASAPTFAEVYPKIRELLESKLVLAYNSAYDWRMLDQDVKRHQQEPFAPMATDCVMELYAQYFGQWNSYKGSFTWQKLTIGCERFGIKVVNEHNAVFDCASTLALLKGIAGRLPDRSDETDTTKEG